MRRRKRVRWRRALRDLSIVRRRAYLSPVVLLLRMLSERVTHRTLESQLATTILSRYPTAASFQGVSLKKLARIIYDGSHKVGEELAGTLIEAATRSAGSHHSEPYRL